MHYRDRPHSSLSRHHPAVSTVRSEAPRFPGVRERQNLPREDATSGHKRRLHGLVPSFSPLAEQRFIVTKVESLFAQTHALEAKQRKAQADIVTVNRATLNRLSVAADADRSRAAWATVGDAYDLLYDDPRNVAELSQAILQLAVQGKLVPGDPADEPASELLKRIHGEKRRLVKEGKISQ